VNETLCSFPVAVTVTDPVGLSTSRSATVVRR
jgi:hypothetical protein